MDIREEQGDFKREREEKPYDVYHDLLIFCGLTDYPEFDGDIAAITRQKKVDAFMRLREHGIDLEKEIGSEVVVLPNKKNKIETPENEEFQELRREMIRLREVINGNETKIIPEDRKQLDRMNINVETIIAIAKGEERITARVTFLNEEEEERKKNKREVPQQRDVDMLNATTEAEVRQAQTLSLVEDVPVIQEKGEGHEEVGLLGLGTIKKDDEELLERKPEENAAEIDYYRQNLLEDLRILYPRQGEDTPNDVWKKMNDRLRKFGIRWITRPSDKEGVSGPRNFVEGRKMIEEIEDYLSLLKNEPEHWKDKGSSLDTSRINLKALREARDRVAETKKVVWYQEAVDDLKAVVNFNDTRENREFAAQRLRSAGVRLPDVIWTEEDDKEVKNQKEFNRFKISTAATVLDGKASDRWTSPRLALEFLRDELGLARGGRVVEVNEAKTVNSEPITKEMPELSWKDDARIRELKSWARPELWQKWEKVLDEKPADERGILVEFLGRAAEMVKNEAGWEGSPELRAKTKKLLVSLGIG